MTPGCSSELEVVALLFRMSLHSNLAIRLDQFHDAQRTKLTGAERTARKRRRRGVRVERVVSPHGLSYAAQLFADDAPQRGFKTALAHITLERLVNEALVIAATRLVDLALKPVNDLVVEPNRDAGFAWCGRRHCPALGFGKVVLSLHRTCAPVWLQLVQKSIGC